MTPIQEFYRGRVVLITGATGFLGKLLLYKLLVACPDIKSIILLLRTKRGKSCSERLRDLFSEAFSEIPESSLNKVSYISADLLNPGLGLSSEDHEILLKSEVSVVFHMAASVRFTDTLDLALRTNLLPTLSLLNICQQIPHLQAFVYASTAYSNFPYKEMINEEIYPIAVDLHQIADIEQLDMEYLENVYKRSHWPNTYTFSKALAESGMQQNNTSLPVAIVRPSTVLNSWKEPAPGWIVKMTGPLTIITCAYLGMKRIALCDSKKVVDIIPADMCINSLLAVAWETAVNGKRGQCKVYNCVSGVQNPITWNQYCSVSEQQIVKFPSLRAQWYYSFHTTRFSFAFCLLWFCLELIPACFLFIIHFFTSSDSNRILQTVIYLFNHNNVIRHFGLEELRFKDSNLRDLLFKLTPEDYKKFNFDIQQLNWTEYLTDHVKGIRQYILKEDFNTLHAARQRYKKLYVIHCAVKICIVCLCYGVLKSLYSRLI